MRMSCVPETSRPSGKSLRELRNPSGRHYASRHLPHGDRLAFRRDEQSIGASIMISVIRWRRAREQAPIDGTPLPAALVPLLTVHLVLPSLRKGRYVTSTGRLGDQLDEHQNHQPGIEEMGRATARNARVRDN